MIPAALTVCQCGSNACPMQVVADMEYDLTEDSKSREMGQATRNSRTQNATDLSEDKTLDWLDNSIQSLKVCSCASDDIEMLAARLCILSQQAMEHWQQTCHSRKAKLNRLREIVEGQAPIRAHDS
eukprot:5497260-Amphidinium_carterae.1